MTAYQRNCYQCGRMFTAERSDAHYCSEKCTAQYHRDHPQGAAFHEDLPKDTYEHCQHCGKGFTFNAYANRGGKRQPQYCSTKCRQAAYRERKKGTSQKQKYAPPPPPPKKTKRDPYIILGVDYKSTKKEIRSAYMKLIKQWHPDINKEPNATQMSQDINWAYEILNK